MQKIYVEQVEIIECLRRCRYCAGADETVLVEIAEGTSLYAFEPRETLFHEGDPCAGLHIVRCGHVKLFKVSPQGRELIVKVLGQGETFNEVPVFDRGPNPVSAAALEESEVWVVKAATMQNALDAHPEMAQAVILNLARNLRMLVDIVEELSFYAVTNRLARLISQLSHEQLTGGSVPVFTQDHLAARLGTVRGVVARSLRELERSGAIRVERRKIWVVDRDMLLEWAGRYP